MCSSRGHPRSSDKSAQAARSRSVRRRMGKEAREGVGTQVRLSDRSPDVHLFPRTDTSFWPVLADCTQRGQTPDVSRETCASPALDGTDDARPALIRDGARGDLCAQRWPVGSTPVHVRGGRPVLCGPRTGQCSLTGRRDRRPAFPVMRLSRPDEWEAQVGILRPMSHSCLTCPYRAGTWVECGCIGRDTGWVRSPSTGEAGTFRLGKCADRPKDARGEAHHGRSDHHVGRQRHFRRRGRLVHAPHQADAG